ncbi:hypothetical protein BDZ94DRAFT_1273605 [Collybia nuda]|uniref:Uncharacterized protein n=1 Tax=Collybia nuda TaxID=64659 RepID=A0A9P5XX49_9AGAR|nr:hypothetical protein BDZ94DRAFT_1273605 [Collybia nuda]
MYVTVSLFSLLSYLTSHYLIFRLSLFLISSYSVFHSHHPYYYTHFSHCYSVLNL